MLRVHAAGGSRVEGLHKSWEACRAQASTAYQRPCSSRRQPEPQRRPWALGRSTIRLGINEAMAPASLGRPGPGVVLHADDGSEALGPIRLDRPCSNGAQALHSGKALWLPDGTEDAMPPRAPANLVEPTRVGASAAAGELDSRMYELEMNRATLAKASDVSIGIIRMLLVGQFANSYRPDKLRVLALVYDLPQTSGVPSPEL